MLSLGLFRILRRHTHPRAFRRFDFLPVSQISGPVLNGFATFSRGRILYQSTHYHDIAVLRACRRAHSSSNGKRGRRQCRIFDSTGRVRWLNVHAVSILYLGIGDVKRKVPHFPAKTLQPFVIVVYTAINGSLKRSLRTAGERNSEPRQGRQPLGRAWSGEAAEPLLGKKFNGTQGTCGDSTFLSRGLSLIYE